MNDKLISVLEQYLKAEAEVLKVRDVPMKAYQKWNELFQNIAGGKSEFIMEEPMTIKSKFLYKLISNIKSDSVTLQVKLDEKQVAIENIKKLTGMVNEKELDALIITYDNNKRLGLIK